MKRTWALLFIEPAFVYNSHPLNFLTPKAKLARKYHISEELLALNTLKTRTGALDTLNQVI